jgi:PAS domain S-box-containing protein
METILLLVGNAGDRRLLEERLGADYDVLVPEDDGIHDRSFDLVVIGDGSFGRYREAIARVKDETPTFLPVLLVCFRRRPEDLGRADWEFLDEVIRTPVDPSELAGRIEGLLQTRHLSLELEQERKRSDRRFRALFDDIPDPVVVLSPDGAIRSANDTFEAAFAGDGERVEGRSIEEVTDVPDGVSEHLTTETPASDLPDVGDLETFTVTTADGAEMIVEVNVEPVVENGEHVEWIAVARDVTAEVERKAELERKNDRLERFASFVSHDLRNPLMIAQDATRAVLEDHGDDENARTIDDSLDRMARLIENVLALVRDGEAVEDPEPVRVESAVQTAWSAFDTHAATVEIDDDIPMVRADADRLVRVFENCFRNTVEHSSTSPRSHAHEAPLEHGGENGPTTTPDLTIRVGPLADGFYVEDDGPGVPAADRDRVFDHGYTTAEDGTGFGLNIVASIAEAHGWSIDVTESQEGGARFEFTGVDFV